ncbi:MAG: hypothetical protein R3F34_07010 [Planctomycetota bacterium]
MTRNAVRLWCRLAATFLLLLVLPGCAAIVGRSFPRPELASPPTGFDVRTASRPSWEPGAAYVLGGDDAALVATGDGVDIEFSALRTGGRIYALGPMLPVLPLFLPDPVGEDARFTVVVFLARSEREVSLDLGAVSAARDDGAPVELRRWARGRRVGDGATRFDAAQAGSVPLDDDPLLLEFDARPDEAQAFDVTVELAWDGGADGASVPPVVRRFALRFARGASTLYAVAA